MTDTTAAAAANITARPPSPGAHPPASIMSPATAVISLVAVITVPMIFYTLFLAMKCPRNPFRRSISVPATEASCKPEKIESSCGGVKYRKSAAGSSDSCSVCLSVFAEGGEIRQLSACKHEFHSACIDKWLSSHSNCPLCRAVIPVKRSKRVSTDGEDDLRQRLPDAASLV